MHPMNAEIYEAALNTGDDTPMLTYKVNLSLNDGSCFEILCHDYTVEAGVIKLWHWPKNGMDTCDIFPIANIRNMRIRKVGDDYDGIVDNE